MNTGSTDRRALSVLNVIITISEAHVGGAERAGLRFGDALATHVDVDTVMMEGTGDDELFADLSLSETVSPLPSYTLVRDVLERVLPSSNNIWNTFIGTRLSTPRPLTEYDLVHIHNPVPLAGMVCVAAQCKLNGIPYCVTTHGISKVPEMPTELGLTRVQRIAFEQVFLRVYKLVLKNATHLYALSEVDRDRIHDWFPGQSVSILANGVDPNVTAEVDDGLRSTTAAESADRPTLLFVGRLMASKGVDDLLEAFRLLEHDCRLVIVGPIREERYRDRIEAGGDRIVYKGYVDQSTLDQLYRDADVFVFPTRSDVFPLVTLEAMAARTPVVTTTVGGLPEQIPESAGILVPPRRPDEFAAAVDELLGDEERRKEMGAAALETVEERYSWDAVARAAVDEYRRFL